MSQDAATGFLLHLRSRSGGALCEHMAVEIGGEAFSCGSEAGVFAEMSSVRRVVVRERKRPGALPRERERFQIKTAECAGRENWVVEKIAIVNPFECHHSFCRRMRHGGELAVATDPDIAVANRPSARETAPRPA